MFASLTAGLTPLRREGDDEVEQGREEERPLRRAAGRRRHRGAPRRRAPPALRSGFSLLVLRRLVAVEVPRPCATARWYFRRCCLRVAMPSVYRSSRGLTVQPRTARRVAHDRHVRRHILANTPRRRVTPRSRGADAASRPRSRPAPFVPIAGWGLTPARHAECADVSHVCVVDRRLHRVPCRPRDPHAVGVDGGDVAAGQVVGRRAASPARRAARCRRRSPGRGGRRDPPARAPRRRSRCTPRAPRAGAIPSAVQASVITTGSESQNALPGLKSVARATIAPWSTSALAGGCERRR